MQKNYPKHLDLPKIRLSITAIVSILHRVSGAGLFVILPFLLWLLASSLNRKESFEYYQAVITNPFIKIILTFVIWGFVHHALAGIRFLFLDIHKGLDLKTAKLTSKIVLIAAPILTLIIAGCLLW